MNARMLARILLGPPRRGSHKQRLTALYAPQAAGYDALRERLLHSRADMLGLLEIEPGMSLCELGGGTGRNLEYLGDLRAQLARIDIVDLCPPLLAVAAARSASWRNVRVVVADAATYAPGIRFDRVYLAYALTMMPEWRQAVDNALRLLQPDGLLGVVDFFVSNRAPLAGHVHHSRLARRFWRAWFAHGGVRLNAAHIDYLDAVSERLSLTERAGAIPYVPLLRAPHYVFVGRKRAA